MLFAKIWNKRSFFPFKFYQYSVVWCGDIQCGVVSVVWCDVMQFLCHHTTLHSLVVAEIIVKKYTVVYTNNTPAYLYANWEKGTKCKIFQTLGTKKTKFPNQESHFRKSFPQSWIDTLLPPPCQSISAILFQIWLE